nr:contractile injection system protein, VgrG/Pvc8 family [uncultured Holophaga sp.]
MLADRPIVKIYVNHRDATGDFTPFLTSLTFTDHMDGEADGLELTLEDVDQRWVRGWYPVKGSTIQAWIGYEGGPLLSCGEFQVDEIEVSGPPDTVTVRAVGDATKKALRTRRSKGYEGASLRTIAQDVASRHGLTLVGTIPDVHWSRVTQHQEADLAFLQRLGSEHGLIFTVKGSSLVFHEIATLEAQSAILTLQRKDVSSWSFRDKVVPSSSSVSFFRGDTKELEVVEVQLADQTHPDKKKSHRRVESKGHARRLAKAALRRHKSYEREGSIALPGNVSLVAGGNVELSGWGVLDGLWLMKSVTHKYDRSGGYATDMEARYVSS